MGLDSSAYIVVGLPEGELDTTYLTGKERDAFLDGDIVLDPAADWFSSGASGHYRPFDSDDEHVVAGFRIVGTYPYTSLEIDLDRFSRMVALAKERFKELFGQDAKVYLMPILD